MSRYGLALASLAAAGFLTANAQAMQGCGAGFHLNGNGRCVPNRAAVAVAPAPAIAVAPVAGAAVVGAAAVGAAAVKTCPIGYHRNANGVCRRN